MSRLPALFDRHLQHARLQPVLLIDCWQLWVCCQLSLPASSLCAIAMLGRFPSLLCPPLLAPLRVQRAAAPLDRQPAVGGRHSAAGPQRVLNPAG